MSNNCTDCGSNNNNGGILDPGFGCQPDNNQLIFKLLESGILGVIKGKDLMSGLDLSDFFMPINNYSTFNIELCDSDPVRIESGAAMDYGKRNEIVEFILFSAPFNTTLDQIDFRVSINGTDFISIEISGEDFNTREEYISLLREGISSNEILQPLIEFNEDLQDSFTILTKTPGKSYIYEFDLGIDDSTPDGGIITQTAKKYPNGAYKLIFVLSEYSSCCGSNEYYYEYAYDSDYIENGESGATWRKSGPLLILNGAEDVEDQDTNKIETLWIRNPHRDCKISIQSILTT